MPRCTPVPTLGLYAFKGLGARNPDRAQFAPDYFEQHRSIALCAVVTHTALEAVGFTGGFVSEVTS